MFKEKYKNIKKDLGSMSLRSMSTEIIHMNNNKNDYDIIDIGNTPEDQSILSAKSEITTTSLNEPWKEIFTEDSHTYIRNMVDFYLMRPDLWIFLFSVSIDGSRPGKIYSKNYNKSIVIKYLIDELSDQYYYDKITYDVNNKKFDINDVKSIFKQSIACYLKHRLYNQLYEYSNKLSDNYNLLFDTISEILKIEKNQYRILIYSMSIIKICRIYSVLGITTDMLLESEMFVIPNDICIKPIEQLFINSLGKNCKKKSHLKLLIRASLSVIRQLVKSYEFLFTLNLSIDKSKVDNIISDNVEQEELKWFDLCKSIIIC